jgi:hypothetical protein
MRRKKTVRVPARPPEERCAPTPEPDQDAEPVGPWLDSHGLRDVTKPVGLDAQGRPLYAPRGVVSR